MGGVDPLSIDAAAELGKELAARTQGGRRATGSTASPTRAVSRQPFSA